MLKITYTDTGLVLERVAQTVEAIVAQRTVLALRVGGSIAVQPTYASLPLPINLPNIAQLHQLAQQTSAISIDRCDRNWLEVTLQGTWIAESVSSDEGIFVTELEAELEGLLLSLWQQAQRQLTASRRVPRTC